MATATQTIKEAPAVTRVREDSLAQVIDLHRECVHQRRFERIGKMVNMMLGPDDDAAYMREKSVSERMARFSESEHGTKGKGLLLLDWGESRGPFVAYAPHRSSCVFPFGIEKPAIAKDHRGNFAVPGKKEQRFEDFASGFIAGRDGSQFLVMQPVLFVGVWIMASLYVMIGHADPATGKYPSLLINPKTKEGHIIGGLLELTTARATGQYMPWLEKAK